MIKRNINSDFFWILNEIISILNDMLILHIENNIIITIYYCY